MGTYVQFIQCPKCGYQGVEKLEEYEYENIYCYACHYNHTELSEEFKKELKGLKPDKVEEKLDIVKSETGEEYVPSEVEIKRGKFINKYLSIVFGNNYSEYIEEFEINQVIDCNTKLFDNCNKIFAKFIIQTIFEI